MWAAAPWHTQLLPHHSNVHRKLTAIARLGPSFHPIFGRASGKDLTDIVGLVAEGKVKVVIDRTLPLGQAAAAHEYVGKGHTKGKVVLTVDEE